MTVQLSRLITSAEIDASKYKAGADQKVAADRAMVASAQAAGQAVVATDTKISQSGDSLARLSRRYIEGQAAQLQFESGLGTIARGLDSGKLKMEQAQSILIGMNQKLGLSANASELAAKGQTQLAAAVSAANAQIQGQALAAEKTIASSKRMQAANANVSVASQSTAPGTFNTANIAAQFQDIGVTAAMGMSPLQIALQQGTQLQAVLGPLGAGGAVKALGGAFLSLVNPVSLVTLALVGGTAAAIQYFMKGRDGAKSMAEATKMHSDTLKLLKEQYGDLAEVIKTVGTVGGQAFTAADVRANQAMLNTMIRSQGSRWVGGMTGGMLTGYLSDANPLTSLLDRQKMGGAQGADFAGPITSLIESARQGHTDIPRFEKDVDSLFKTLATRPGADVDMLANTRDSVLALGEAAFEVKGKFEPFQQVINRFQIEVAENHPNLSRFNADIEAIGATQGITKLADEVISLGKDFVETARQAQELKLILDRIDRENTRPGLADRRALGGYVAGRDAALGRENDQFEAEQQMARARTNAEKLAAIEAQVRARAAQDADKGGGLQARVDRALQAERNRQAIEARDAELDRGRAIDKTLASQQLDLQLIGKTAGETARLRMEFEQIAAIREEAALKGVPADEAEIARIKEKAAAYGLVADEIARANLAKDLNFEREQQFRSAQDQQIASRQQGAGLDVDLNSPAAQQMRDIARFADAKGLAVGFLTDFKSELLRNGGDVGKALGESILNALTTSMDKQLADIFDRLATWFASLLTGQMPGGSLASGAGFAANTTLSAFLGASNDNYAPGAVTRSPLGAVGGNMAAYASAIRSIESAGSGGYSALGPWTNGDRAYGAYQVMGNNIPSWSKDALGKSLSPDQFLADPAAQDAIFQKQFGKYLSKYGNPQDAASAWFTGGPLKSGAGATDVLGTSGSVYVDKFNAAVDKATQGLGGLDTTVTKTIGSLAGGVGGAGGGLASILEGLKPGNFTPDPGGFAAMLGIGAGTPAPAAGGGGGLLSMLLGFLPKLFGFADGTENAPEGWAWVGERGPELRKLRGGDVIRSNGHSMNMAANANMSARGGGRGQEGRVELHVNVYGGSGDEHIRLLARQGAQQAIGDYHEAQASGGFGELQRRYNSQKA
ncbi:phage tail length tape measure family protein [Mesorhizobium sp. M0578]|uniref:phage tail length tape measure family protein n=1 Tax=unclassified Mesorhizobium TaxID=325217 RepID=UPI00333C7F3A